MVLTVYTFGLRDKEKGIKDEEINIGDKVVLEKSVGELNDYLIKAYINDKLFGEVSQVPMIKVNNSQILTEELYNSLPKKINGYVSKIEFKLKKTKPIYLYEITIDNKEINNYEYRNYDMKEEIKSILNSSNLNLDVNNVYKYVETNRLTLLMNKLFIYEAIQKAQKDLNISNEDIDRTIIYLSNDIKSLISEKYEL